MAATRSGDAARPTLVQEGEIERILPVPTVSVIRDGRVVAHGQYAIFVDTQPGIDGRVMPEWVHHVILNRTFSDWHMPCEPRLEEIMPDDELHVSWEGTSPTVSELATLLGVADETDDLAAAVAEAVIALGRHKRGESESATPRLKAGACKKGEQALTD